MKHGEFIAKYARYAPVLEAYIKGGHRLTLKQLGERFNMLPMVANAALNFARAHEKDPQRPEFSDETHDCVMVLSTYFDLSSPESIRAGLLAKFKASPPDGKLNHKHSVRPSILKKVMIASGLKWFELDGTPYIMWTEQ